MEDDRGGLERRLMDRAEGMERMGRYQSPLTGLLREAADAIGAARRAIRGTIVHCNSCEGTGYSGVMLLDEPAEGESPLVKLTCPRCLFLRKALVKLEGGG